MGDGAEYVSAVHNWTMKEALDYLGKPMPNRPRFISWRGPNHEVPDLQPPNEEPWSVILADWDNASNEVLLNGLTGALWRGDVYLHNHLLSILGSRIETLLLIARRFEERFGTQLGVFLEQEIGASKESVFASIGLRPGPRLLHMSSLGRWVSMSDCDRGCKESPCEHEAPFFFVPDRRLITEAAGKGDIIPDEQHYISSHHE
jgi:hypothetical protein